MSKTCTSSLEILMVDSSSFPSTFFTFKLTVENGEELSQDTTLMDERRFTVNKSQCYYRLDTRRILFLFLVYVEKKILPLKD